MDSAGEAEGEGRRARGVVEWVLAAARWLVGLRRSVSVAGVRYREVGTEPLRHALSRHGSGHKDYDATFPDGTTMRIRVTPRRAFADLGGPDRLGPVFGRAEAIVRPGMRVLALQSGTGRVGAWLSERVGPSGAVVALDEDEQSVRFAQRRYARGNVAYEVGGPESLAGETDGAFDAVLAAMAAAPRDAGELSELWRVVGEGGWLFVAHPAAGESTLAATLSALRAAWDEETGVAPAGSGDAGAGRIHPGVCVLSGKGEAWVAAAVGKPPA